MSRSIEVPFVPFVLSVFAALLFVVVFTIDVGSGDARRPLVYPDGQIVFPDDPHYHTGGVISSDSVQDGGGSGGPEPAQVDGPNTISSGSQV